MAKKIEESNTYEQQKAEVEGRDSRIKDLEEENTELQKHVSALKSTNAMQLDKLVQAELREKAMIEAMAKEVKKNSNGHAALPPVNGTALTKKVEV